METNGLKLPKIKSKITHILKIRHAELVSAFTTRSRNKFGMTINEEHYDSE